MPKGATSYQVKDAGRVERLTKALRIINLCRERQMDIFFACCEVNAILACDGLEEFRERFNKKVFRRCTEFLADAEAFFNLANDYLARPAK